ncbi:MAG TPA: FtsX-like permease family protein, partial [Streptosporangiaceae bacterium]|nr:FtsX-like permease family protein [Streptosporangiaceae bacterium]
RAVWLRVRAGLRQDWRGPLALALITALMGSLVLVSLAGARRTDTAVPRFLAWSGPTEGQVAGVPFATLGQVARLPDVAYGERGAFMLIAAARAGHLAAARPGQVTTWALIDTPPQAHAILVAGRRANPSRAGEVMINETAARIMGAHVGSVIQLRGFRPDQVAQVLNNQVFRPAVSLPDVRVTGIIRSPSDLGDSGAPANVTFYGTGSLFLTAAFYHRFAGSVGNMFGLSFHLKRGLAGLPAFRAEVRRLTGGHAQVQLGSDDAIEAAVAENGTSLQALALLLFGVVVILAMLVIVAQSIARLAYASAADFPVLRALGARRGQLFAVALAPGALVAATGMALAIPAAYGLSVFTPVGLARRAEISPGLSFDAPILLGGAALVTLLLTARAALSALRVSRMPADGPAGTRVRGSRVARWMARQGFSAPAVSGVRMAFEPEGNRPAAPVRSAVLGTVLALAAVVATLVFGASLDRVIADPRLAGWNWDVAVGNPHSGDTAAQTEPGLRANADLAGFTATALGDTGISGRDVPVVGIQPLRGHVTPPVLAGRLPRGPREIALGGGELRALHQRVGGLVRAQGPHGPVALRIVGQVVLSPEITNEQVKLGYGAVMTLAGAAAVSRSPMPVNVYLVRLLHSGDLAAIARLQRQFPGVVLPAVAPPEVRELQGVSGLPLALASVLTLLAVLTIAHTLVTSVRRRRRDLAILKTVGFVGRQVRATVGWQATAIAAAGLVIGLPLGAAAGRWAWTLLAQGFAIEPVAVISPALLLAVPAVLLLANAVAAIPARTAARTRPAVVLRAE